MEINKIYNMDCLEGIKKIPDGSIKAVCTDPPYFLGMTHNGKKGTFNDLNIAKPFFSELTREIKRVLDPDKGCMYFFTDWRGYAFYYPVMQDNIGVSNLLVWDKGIKSFTTGAKAEDGGKIHSTQKPTALIRKLIENSTEPGDTVLDCFMGSGTTAIAAMQTGRNYIGFEIDEKYYNIATKRVEDYILSYTD